MKPTTVLLCAALAAFSATQAQEVRPAEPAAAAGANPMAGVPMDKVSYYIGKTIGGQMAQQKEQIDPKEFLQGVKDAMTSKKSTSYMAGNGLGQQFSSEQLPIDLDKFAAGISAASQPDAKPAYTTEELTAAMELYEKAVQAKQEASLSPEQRAELAKERADMENRGKSAKEEGAKFLAENGKRKGVTTTGSGLQYEVIKAGTGPKPTANDNVNVHYHGTHIDGRVFDSSVERGEPINLSLGGVIPGWTEALQLMPVGSKWRLFIPSNLAYGERGSGASIGPNETLVFDVELLGIVK